MTTNYTWERVEAGWYVQRATEVEVLKGIGGWWTNYTYPDEGPFKSKKAAIERAEEIIDRWQAPEWRGWE